MNALEIWPFISEPFGFHVISTHAPFYLVSSTMGQGGKEMVIREKITFYVEGY